MGPAHIELLHTSKSSLLGKTCRAPDVASDLCTVLDWLLFLLSELHIDHGRQAWPGSNSTLPKSRVKGQQGGSCVAGASPYMHPVFSLDNQAAALCYASCLLVQLAGSPTGSTTSPELHSSGNRHVVTHV